jgi:hypothetical protein
MAQEKGFTRKDKRHGSRGIGVDTRIQQKVRNPPKLTYDPANPPDDDTLDQWHEEHVRTPKYIYGDQD